MIHSFLLIGQSNMAGRGYLEEAEEVDQSRIRILRSGRWQSMFRPINPDRSFSGVSLAESFAEAYAKKYDVDVGLICCADGGTSLEQWQPGGLLADNAIYQAKLAQRTSTITGVLWHQGEADCNEDAYSRYEKRFAVLMAALRSELGLHDVPFLLGGLGDFLKGCSNGELKDYVYVNDALQSIAQNHPMTGFVSAKGLGSNPDKLHFHSKALYEFGLRYFDEFERLRNPNKIFAEKAVMDDAVRSSMELL